MAVLLLNVPLLSAQIYVSASSGSDVTGTGSSSNPFKTISKAVAMSAAGDVVYVGEGVYRETVSPTVDNLTIKALNGEAVTISGCDPISGGWGTAAHDASIKTNATATRVMQVFIGEDRMNLARFPNEDPSQNMFDYSEFAQTVTRSGENVGTGIADVDFNANANMPDDGPDTWVGGSYMGINGTNVFTAAVGKITASNGNRLTCTDLSFYWRTNPTAVTNVGAGKGYVINHLRALDAPTEWYSADDGTFYLYPPNGVDLNTVQVDVRTRLWGMDLSGRSGVTIEGIHFFASSVLMDESQNCVMRDCHVEYPAPWSNYYHGVPGPGFGASEEAGTGGSNYGGKEDGSSGVFVSGSNNLVENCWIEKSWGSGIRLEGTDNTVQGCLVEDIGWMMRRHHPIQAFGLRTQVLNNTVRKCSQSAIDGGNRLLGGVISSQITVRNNVIEKPALVLHDCGAFYINHQGQSSNGTEFAYNVIKDNTTNLPYGFYGDNGTDDMFVHHNLMDIPLAWIGIRFNGSRNKVFNNTVMSPDEAIIHQRSGYEGQVVQNNLGNKKIKNDGQFAIVSNNATSADSSSFVNAAIGDFRIAPSYARAIDSGVEHSPYTDGFNGVSPDLGCYEFGQPIWNAGSWVNAEISTAAGTLLSTAPTDPIVIDAAASGALADLTIVHGAMGVIPVTLNEVPVDFAPSVTLLFNGQTSVLLGAESAEIGANDFAYTVTPTGNGKATFSFQIQRNTTWLSTPWRIQISSESAVPPASGMLYSDSFDEGAIGSNSDLGGGMGNFGATAGDAWNEDATNGQIVYQGSGGGNRANAYSLNAFEVTNGFTLDIAYAIDSLAVSSNNQFSFGLVANYTPNQNNSFIAVDDYGIGFNLTPGTGGNDQGLILSEGGAIPSSHLLLSPFVTGTGGHSLQLTVTPNGSGGADWSYRYDGGAAVSGSIASFDFAQSYHFVAHARDGSIAKSIQSVSLSVPSSGPTELVYSNSFDDGALGTNSGAGSGMGSFGATSGDEWIENPGSGQITYQGSGAGNRASVYSFDTFDLSEGVILEVDYTISSLAVGSNNQFSFGLVADYAPNQNNSFITVNDYGIGFNLTPGTGSNDQGLILSEGGAIPSNHILLSPFVTGTGAHSLELTLMPDGTGGADWSYHYDGGAAVSGSVASFDFSKLYTFVAHARDGSISKSLQEVKVTVGSGSSAQALMAQWALDENAGSVASDLTGNGHDGTVVSATWTPGIDGSALAFDGASSSVSLPASAFANVGDEISIALWAKGDLANPVANSVFYAADSSGSRLLNVHLPWGNGEVYWDAGDELGYDRIQKAATPSEYEGAWQHWVFTKNANTGVMNIYLNGALWHTGTGLVASIGTVDAASLGSNLGTSSYHGTIDDVLLFNVALSSVEVEELYLAYAGTGQ
ncbi:LamG-like jellyroll fold domain-containing protein [Pelagicoccus sp. SDUM812005]|uniref:LamG-like jellyroll fold domain-containing protein n=1 Tax=Pelagicoccus sp. SDUM812005 TaxID=3041257 RepID=UPI0028115CAC|nr:LamG-like jellyroll fold domain-containing protein [Pelagicoccus sp. SDUM812005]